MVRILQTQYYYLDLYQRFLNYPHYNNHLSFYIPPQIHSVAQNVLLNPKTQPSLPQVAEPQPTLKIQYDQKISPEKCIFSAQKNVNIISKKSKIKKINFVDKRNIIPNNINHILAFVQRKSKSQKIIKKIIARQKKQYQSYNIKAFYSYQIFVKNKLSVHVNTKALEAATTHLDYQTQIFKPEEQLFYNKVSRIAVLYYLRNIAPLVTLQSHRLKNTCKDDHLKVQRYLLSVLESLCFEQSLEQGNKITNL